jgi:hypothetical protein
MVYSFTSKQPNAVALFAQLFTDKTLLPDKTGTIGQSYLNVVQVKCQYLLRYLIASLVISGNFETLQEHILPAVVQEKGKYSDISTNFLQTLFEDFDFPAALKASKDLGKAASEDILLKGFANEVQSQATMLIFQVKARIYRSVNIKELVEETASLGMIKNEEEARTRLEDSLRKEGFHLEALEGTNPEAKNYFKVMG